MTASRGSEDRAGGPYRMRLYGPCEVSSPAGDKVTPRSKRARALLGYLALVPPRSATRESIAALLWSERGDEQARASLRQVLFELRPLVGADRLLIVSRDAVKLVPGSVVTDLDDLDRAVAASDFSTVITLLTDPGGTLLSDISEIDPAFSDWLVGQREQHREARRVAALQLCRDSKPGQDIAQTLRLARLLTLSDPLDEAAVVVAMEAAHGLGDIATIRRLFATLAEALKRDLGVTPSQATVETFKRLVGAMPPITRTSNSALTPAIGTRLGDQTPALFWRQRRTFGAVFAIIGLTAIVAAVPMLHRAFVAEAPPASPPIDKGAVRPLPDNPAAAELFLQARDDLATRSSTSLGHAVNELDRVTRMEPGYAPAFADLADAYLLGGEAGSLSQAVAFDRAEQAADRAQLLNPGLSAAHRAKGFILYWWKHQAKTAGVEFREAIRIDPSQPLTHFWYANVLTDAGQQPQAFREFNKARLADPGSDQIAADYAWALWTFGQDDEARVRLAEIVRDRPKNVEAQDCAASVALAQRDYVGFLRAYRRRAELRHEASIDAHERKYEDAFRASGSDGLLRELVSSELADQADTPFPDHSEAAFFASLAHDRTLLLRVLDIAARAHERWGARGYLWRMQRAWTGDVDVVQKLIRLAGDRVEPI